MVEPKCFFKGVTWIDNNNHRAENDVFKGVKVQSCKIKNQHREPGEPKGTDKFRLYTVSVLH